MKDHLKYEIKKLPPNGQKLAKSLKILKFRNVTKLLLWAEHNPPTLFYDIFYLFFFMIFWFFLFSLLFLCFWLFFYFLIFFGILYKNVINWLSKWDFYNCCWETKRDMQQRQTWPNFALRFYVWQYTEWTDTMKDACM